MDLDHRTLCGLAKVRAKRIRTEREKLGWNQLDLAVAIGCSQQAVAKWELGLAQPRDEWINALAYQFGITYNDLIEQPRRKQTA